MTVHDGTDAEEVARNPWGVILHYKTWRTLELNWLPGEMSDADFKQTLELLAGMGEQLRPQFMIIDAVDFHHDFAPGVMEWRDENIIPRYGAAGVTKFAFIVPAGVPGTIESGGQPSVEGTARFPTAWFSTRERAYQWLTSQ